MPCIMRTTGISSLAKEALSSKREIQMSKDVPVFAKPWKGVKVTLELVNKLRDENDITFGPIQSTSATSF